MFNDKYCDPDNESTKRLKNCIKACSNTNNANTGVTQERHRLKDFILEFIDKKARTNVVILPEVVDE